MMDKKENSDTSKNSNSWGINDSLELYKIDRWGDGYFGVTEGGTLCVLPDKNEKGPRICISQVIEEMKEKGISFPAVIRFQDILRSQVSLINKYFQNSIEKHKYRGTYYGVYPIKVNQIREVVEEVVDAGGAYNYGLEAGSKSELMAILALNKNQNSLNLLNGYKDKESFKLALLGSAIGKKVVVIIEKISELPELLEVSKEVGVTPLIGVRAKLISKSGGIWSESSGEKAKFGLTSAEILEAVRILKEENMLSSLVLFHFHIGSQIPEINILRDAIKEGARIYTKICKLGVTLKYFDVGGGAGLNYDGDYSGNSVSVNYSLEEYIDQVVEVVKGVCDQEEVDHPHLVSESGRVISGHHSCVITDVYGEIDRNKSYLDLQKKAGEHPLVQKMRTLLEEVSEENYQDTFNRITHLKEESFSAFKHGIIDLQEKAMIEEMFHKAIKAILSFAHDDPHAPLEILEMEEELINQYLCNFSVFQSIPDAWAIEQILPVVPIQRLNEKPNLKCMVADLTCDSDGKIKNYIGEYEKSSYLNLHKLNQNPYYIGIFMTGAYQDVMGDMHNLFGRLNEVHVFCDDDDPTDFYIEEYIKGSSAAEVLSILQYNPEYMAFEVKKLIDKQVSRGKIKPRRGVELADFYEECLHSYTYLKR